MTVSKRTFLFWFLSGLGAFAVTLVLHLPLVTEGVGGGIADHQRAPDAATVDAIHAAWKASGVYAQAHWAMVADLIFIGIYGLGCVLGGLHYIARSQLALRTLGWIALFSGIVFLFTDYGETVAQFIQLVRNRGSDHLAEFASTLRPVKMATWIGAFLAIVAALIAERFSTSDA
ncbi:MAG: hypothetical protein QNJ15_11970 [Erythrobacter sp.]|nr:hypothetical protein [Erythrobacter sp.]